MGRGPLPAAKAVLEKPISYLKQKASWGEEEAREGPRVLHC